MNLEDPYPVNCIFIPHDGSLSSTLGLSFLNQLIHGSIQQYSASGLQARFSGLSIHDN